MHTLTRGQLRLHSLQVAAALRALGLQPGMSGGSHRAGNEGRCMRRDRVRVGLTQWDLGEEKEGGWVHASVGALLDCSLSTRMLTSITCRWVVSSVQAAVACLLAPGPAHACFHSSMHESYQSLAH